MRGNCGQFGNLQLLSIGVTIGPMLFKASVALPLLLTFAHGAFIRHWPCDLDDDVLSGYQFDPWSLRGSLDLGDGNTTLFLQMAGDFIHDDCDELHGASAVLGVDARVLGSSVVHGNPSWIDGACPTLSPKENPRWVDSLPCGR
jgi:hypothetical protein